MCDVSHHQDVKESANKFKKWKIESLEVRDSLNIPHGYHPYQPTQLLGINTGCGRVMDLLNVAYAARLKQGKGPENFFAMFPRASVAVLGRMA